MCEMRLAAQVRGVTDDPGNPLHARYGENALVGWLRSHPRVAQEHWSDVLARRVRDLGCGYGSACAGPVVRWGRRRSSCR